MEEKRKNKNELIKEAQELADKYFEKKSVIETALNDLGSKKKIGPEHLKGMAIIEELFNELDLIELEQLKVFDDIKKK
jgi:ubiquinone biosynthesis protein COQ9